MGKRLTDLKYEIRAGAYYDSAVLMQLQRSLVGLPGVVDAGVVMATQANLDLLADGYLLPDGITPRPEDLLIVIAGESPDLAQAAFDQVDDLLAHRPTALSGQFTPRSLESAVNMLPDSNWVLVSVPGRYAAQVAEDALNLGRHVFLYSDNVSVEDEVRLKSSALEKGLVVMGPDCGTAIINGIGFGFANRVRQGAIGLVAAAGTGLQAVSVGIHNLGAGLSQAIGTGGRDLHPEVGGRTARQALDLLGRDPQTQAICLISKPPDLEVANAIGAAARATGKPVVIYFIGYPPPARQVGSLHYASSLDDAARLVVSLLGASSAEVHKREQPGKAAGGFLRGLFSGGTLAYEVMLGLQVTLSPLYSNVPLNESQRLQDPLTSQANTIIDLGSDEFTVGRLHPMLDNDLRIRRFQKEAADPQVGMILFDFVLGEGAHPDPASEFGPVIKTALGERSLEVVALVVGTDQDPQGIDSQIHALREAGARVFTDLSSTISYVSGVYQGKGGSVPVPVPLTAFEKPVAAINVGLESFYASLIEQGAKALHVDWRPPAGGNEALLALLKKMGS